MLFQQFGAWLWSGQGRLAAAVLLYLLVWVLKSHVPFVKKWLQSDSGWITTDRKKLLANVILAAAPLVTVLSASGAEVGDSVVRAVELVLGAAGIQGVLKGALGKQPPAS
jgi:hypothetical protein